MFLYEMITVDEMARIKRLKGYSYKYLSEKTGIEAGTIQKILTGQTKNPRHDTIERLQEAFRPDAALVREGVSLSEDARNAEGVVREAQAAYGRPQGMYTLDDWLRISEDQRVELIDGVIIYLESPLIIHQEIIGAVQTEVRNFIRSNHGKCRSFIAPAAVQLDEDDKTMVEPDLFIVCRPDQIKEVRDRFRVVTGAPDFVMEVLSPSTAKRDMTLKLRKYEDAGVKEYWVVDPDHQIVIVYEFAKDAPPGIYPFSKAVPVGIYEGALEIDFGAIVNDLEDWLAES